LKNDLIKPDYNKEAIFCDSVCFSYDEQQNVINNISLKISRGEKIGIIGPNGAGKSTFLTLLNGLRFYEGRIEIFGIPVESRFSKIIKSTIGLVFQNPDDQLFSPTVYEDVAFGPLNLGLSLEDAKKRVDQALEEVGLKDVEERFGLHLSIGERKLVAIATILSMLPEIIAMDEPTSNLDPAHRRKIINWIKDSDRTLIMTTHDLDMVLETCNRVYIFNKGQIRAAGTIKEIILDKNLLEKNDLELPLGLQQDQLPANLIPGTKQS